MRYLIVDIVLILVLCSRCVLGLLFRSLLLCVFCVLLFCFLSLIFSFVLGLALPSCCLFSVLFCGVLCSLVLCSCFCCSILFLFLVWHLLFLFIRDLVLCCLFVVLVVCVLISFVFYALLLFCSLLLFFGLHFWFLVFGFGIVLCFWRLLDVYSYCCSVALCVKCTMFLFFILHSHVYHLLVCLFLNLFFVIEIVLNLDVLLDPCSLFLDIVLCFWLFLKFVLVVCYWFCCLNLCVSLFFALLVGFNSLLLFRCLVMSSCFWRLLDVYSYCCSCALCVKCSMFLFFILHSHVYHLLVCLFLNLFFVIEIVLNLDVLLDPCSLFLDIVLCFWLFLKFVLVVCYWFCCLNLCVSLFFALLVGFNSLLLFRCLVMSSCFCLLLLLLCFLSSRARQ